MLPGLSAPTIETLMPAYGFIPSPSSNGFSVGSLFFRAYGIACVVAIWGFPAGRLGGRIYFLITTPSQVPDHWWGPFAVWQGGLGIWGGIAAGVAGGIYILRKRLPWPGVLRFMDAAAPGLLVA